MVELRQTKTDKEISLTDREFIVILDALLHEMERHNTAADLVTNPQVRQAIKAAKAKIMTIYQRLFSLRYTEDEDKAAQIAAKYFADFDAERHRGTDSRFKIDFTEWCKFCKAHGIAYPSRTFEGVLIFHFIGTKEENGQTTFDKFFNYLSKNRIL